MKKIFSVLLVLTLILSITAVANAKNKEVDSKSKLELKVEQAKRLKKDGTIKKLDEKIKKYYEENKNKLIDFSKLSDLNSPEAQKILKQIEEEMAKYSSNINSDDSTVGTDSLGSGPPTGSNSIDYTYFDDADIILVHDGSCIYGYYRHGGTYDAEKGNFISAQYSSGVIRESKDFYRGYDEAIGLYVNYKTDDPYHRSITTDSIINYLRLQLGKPYALSSKDNESSWYCTKLPWKGWYRTAAVDIDYNGGYLCLPDDIYYDSDTVIFASAD